MAEKRSYLKPALSYEQQVERLQSRGLLIADPDSAAAKLASVSYYRLSAYWLPMRARGTAGALLGHFESNARFETAVMLYEFDRHLRLHVLDALERIEIAVRTRFTYHLAHTYGPFGYLDSHNFRAQFGHAHWLKGLQKEAGRSTDKFIEHYKENYKGFPELPIWMMTEVISLGTLSHGYKGLRNDRKTGIEDQKAIADHFNLHYRRLQDWLHKLTYIRNVCAHHSRLWNRELAVRPDKMREEPWQPPQVPSNERVFIILLMLSWMLHQIGEGEHWRSRLIELLEPVAKDKRWRIAMGMPDDWRNHPYITFAGNT